MKAPPAAPQKAGRFDALIAYVAVFYSLFVVASAIQYVFRLTFWSIPVMLTVFMGFYMYNRARVGAPSDFGQWIRDNKLKVWLASVVSVMCLITCYGKSDLLSSKGQLILDKVRVTFGWQFLYAVGVILCLKLLVWDTLLHKGPPVGVFFRIMVSLPVLLLVSARLLDVFRTCDIPPGPDGEFIFDGEVNSIHKMMTEIERLVRAKAHGEAGAATRAVHPKAHGCVRGEFSVERDVRHHWRHGVFQAGKKYPVWARFSNGDSSPTSDDRDADVRGMALKLLNIPGESIVADDGNTQDFVLITSDHFFTRESPEAYLDFMHAVVLNNPYELVKWFAGFSFNPADWRWRTLTLMIKMYIEGSRVTNPLTTTYFSATPYKLGDLAVKYSTRPCLVDPLRVADDATRLDGANFLREAMRRQLNAEEVCYEFLIQEQGTDACKDPVEDSTTPWSGTWSKAATITFPKQTFLHYDQIDFCESLSYSPWHALPDHRPLGALNRFRRGAYEAGAIARAQLNNVSHVPVTGHEVFTRDELRDENVGAGNTKEFQFARYDAPFTDLPTKIRKFPPSQDFDVKKYMRIAARAIKANKELLQHKGKKRDQFTHPDDFKYYFDLEHNGAEGGLPLPALAHTWKADETFARQYISGINPMMITVVTDKIPARFDLSPENMTLLHRVIKERGGEDVQIDDLIKQRRLFVADYKWLENIDPTDGRYLYAPLVLFYRLKGKELLPLVIQLTRESTFVNEIYTPLEANQDAWLWAKMLTASADGQVHEMISHLGFTHLAMEPVIVAFYRQVPESHPIFKLMVAHFRQTLAINEMGRNSLLHPLYSVFQTITSSGLAGTLGLMASSYKSDYSLLGRSFGTELKARGFDEVKPGTEDIMPGFHYRDDGFMVWNALEKYITGVVEEVYANDKAVADDVIIRAWMHDMADPGLGAVPGVPTIKDRAMLIHTLTTIVYTCSAQHSAVNFGQFDFYGFIPNRPLLVRKNMPDDRSKVNIPYIMAALADNSESIDTVYITRLLSLPSTHQIDPETNTHVGYTFFKEAPVTAHTAFPKQYEALIKELERIDAFIEARNAKLPPDQQYSYLRPSEIASSIAI